MSKTVEYYGNYFQAGSLVTIKGCSFIKPNGRIVKMIIDTILMDINDSSCHIAKCIWMDKKSKHFREMYINVEMLDLVG